MEKLFKELSDAQATLFVLYHKTWVFHWNVVGQDFFSLHELFGQQYLAMAGEIDRISENLRYLNIRPISTLNRIAEVSKITESSSDKSSKEMVLELIADNKKLLEVLTSALKAIDSDSKFIGTSNIIEDLIEAHGKNIWMLSSISQ